MGEELHFLRVFRIRSMLSEIIFTEVTVADRVHGGL